MRLLGCAAAVAIAASWCQTASANTIVENFDFTASNLTALFSSDTPPFNPVHGSFTLTFDPTKTYLFGDAPLVLNSIDINLNAQSGTPEFEYIPGAQQLLVGMSYNGGGAAGGGSDDFILSLFLGYQYDKPDFTYYQAGDNNGYDTRDVTFTADPPLTSTPLPPSALMLVTALGGLGGFGWLRRRDGKASATAPATV